ncbi:primary-amine oxidase [Cohnella hashimotonis]|uniref:Amine oxidase n=1 Tax=Cohnella hashimotonis TaxID=2826895 RepID=A0ABT6TQC6_9BACL|nr:primary-amine oxidase [Cohnella hashimotonis]MDI4649054.1 primary-amine oxidase [Cohnella hashimotonis]
MKRKKMLVIGTAVVALLATGLIPGGAWQKAEAVVVAPTAPYDPLNPLNAHEIRLATSIIKKSSYYKPDMNFDEIALEEPDKNLVWNWTLSSDAYKSKKINKLSRMASFVISEKRQIFEGVVDLDKGTIVSWKENKDGGFYFINNAQANKALEIVLKDPDYLAALKKRGITDTSKLTVYGLPVEYNDKDENAAPRRLYKYETLLNVGDGNDLAHLVNNLLVTVDIDEQKVIAVEDDGVVPVPTADQGYNRSGKTEFKEEAHPIVITQPKGAGYTIKGQEVTWGDWKFHVRMDSRRGTLISAASYNDNGTPRKVLYSGGLGGMTVPYGDASLSWYFKTYMDAGEYGLGKLARKMVVGADVPANTTLIDATLNDDAGAPYTLPKVIGVFERYADSDWTHAEYDGTAGARARTELVVRYITVIGNYDYTFDYIFQQNGNIKIDVGASGVEAAKSAFTAKVDSSVDEYVDESNDEIRNGTLVAPNTVAVYHQHIYNFRLDMDVDGQTNTAMELQPVTVAAKNDKYRKSEMVLEQKTYRTELEAAQKFDPDKVVLLTNSASKNKAGYVSGYQIIANAGGTHPFAEEPLFTADDELMQRAGYMKKHIWVTPYKKDEIYPEGKYVTNNAKDTGLGAWTQQNRDIYEKDDVVWVTTGTTHIPRSEEWPMMSTEWVSMLLKPFNFLDSTPTLDLPKPKSSDY